MQATIGIAHDRGVGVAAVSDTGHFGAAAYWALMAADAGLIGLATSNMAGPCMLATGSRQPATGNTPLAWAFPTHQAHPVVLDMASGAYALNKLHMVGSVSRHLYRRASPRTATAIQPLTPQSSPTSCRPAAPRATASGWCTISWPACSPATAPRLIKGATRPREEPDTARQPVLPDRIDVGAFLPLDDFRTAMDEQSRAVNALPPAAGFSKVQMPGQPEWELFEDRAANGIAYPPGVQELFAAMAAPARIGSARRRLTAAPHFAPRLHRSSLPPLWHAPLPSGRIRLARVRRRYASPLVLDKY